MAARPGHSLPRLGRCRRQGHRHHARHLDGFCVTDAGPLKNARYLEPLAGLNIYFGYGAGRGTAISPTWVAAA